MAKSKTKKSSKSETASNDDGMIHDERFQIAQTHPQFQKRHTKKKDDGNDGGLLLSSSSGKDTEEVDERFKAILTDSRFAIGGDIGLAEGGVDKYGRKMKKKKKKDQKLQIDDEGDDDDAKKDEDGGYDTSDTEKSDQEKNQSDQDGDDEVPDDPESRIAYLTALSRGEIDVSSSSEEETSSDEDNDDGSTDDDASTGSEDSIRGTAGVLDPSTKDETLLGNDASGEIELTFDDSRFLAICNIDWENMRAVDLLAIVSSFSPPGSVKCVKVYPSDFGMERMERDRTLGPVGIWKKKEPDEEDESENDYNDEDKHSDDESNASESGAGSEAEEGGDIGIDDDESIDEEILKQTYGHFESNSNSEQLDSDFDPEKLRAYEASKLKYYFAVAEFTTPMAADQVYKELDGLEIGSSSTAVDLRAIPDDSVEDATKGRKIRDEASTIPSNYSSPDFVVNALQKTEVECTWEEGDKERERLLTQYGVGNNAWAAMRDGDDLKAYLASDVSSDEDSDDDADAKEKKVSNMRKLLGLGGSDDDDDDKDDFLQEGSEVEDDDSFFGSGNLSDGGGSDDEGAQEMTFIPGKSSLKEKIRTKLKEKEEGVKELTPWEKYQLKRKEKRKEKKRNKKQQKAAFQGEDIGDSTDAASFDKKSQNTSRVASSKEELDLLLAGDDDEEAEKDFHMRDLVRIEKNKSKKLRGSRKRKEDDIAANASGLDFKLDTKDSRFAAVLDGTDDRFGIDRTDPQFKETAAMREILQVQTKRRKSKKRRKTQKSTDVNADSMNNGTESGGALALSSLVKSLKSKVAK